MTPRDGKVYPLGGRDQVEVTVTYLRADEAVALTRTGWGRRSADALEDADSKLPAGVWTRLSVSNANSIYADLKRRHANTKNRAAHRGEGVTVEVTAPQVRQVSP